MNKLIEDKEVGRGVVNSRSLKGTTETKTAFGPDDAWRSINVYEFDIGSRSGDMPEKIVKAMNFPYETGDILIMYETSISKHRYVEIEARQ